MDAGRKGNEMQTITATPIRGLHCENCGGADPQVDDGYTTCCNELTCYGESSRDRWAIEKDDKLVAVVVGSCCGATAFAAAAGLDSDGGHLDCTDPRCAAHSGQVGR